MPTFTRRHSPLAVLFPATRCSADSRRRLPFIDSGSVTVPTMNSEVIAHSANIARRRVPVIQFFSVCPVAVACWAPVAVGKAVAVFAAACAVGLVWSCVHCRHAFNGAPLQSGCRHQRSGLDKDQAPHIGQTRHIIFVTTSKVTQAAHGTPCRSVFRSQVGQ